MSLADCADKSVGVERMETVIVAFENNKNALRVKEILEEDGAADCLVCRTADQVRRASRQFRVPVVVCGYKLGDQTAQLIFDDLPACAMLVLARQDVLELMDNDEIFRLPAPASRVDLLASVRMLLQVGLRLEQRTRPQRSQEELALISQAKAVLMDRSGMSEEQAHRYLQKKSMNSGARLTQTAQLVLDGTQQR